MRSRSWGGGEGENPKTLGQEGLACKGLPRFCSCGCPAVVFFCLPRPRDKVLLVFWPLVGGKNPLGLSGFYLAKGKGGKNAPAGTGREDSEPPRVTPGGGQEEGGAGGKWGLV